MLYSSSRIAPTRLPDSGKSGPGAPNEHPIPTMPADARILLVEDDRELCAMLSNFFSEHGMSLFAVHDGDEAARALRAPDFDLAILDVMLPLKPGLDVLVELRHYSECPVLILTARGDDVDRVRGLELGADDYLAKPFNPRELLARVRAILRRALR